MSATEVYLHPDQTRKCWPRKVAYAKYGGKQGQHQRRKYGIKSGPGRDSDWVICAACANSDQKPAITREEIRLKEEAAAAAQAEIDRRRKSLYDRYGAWIPMVLGFLALQGAPTWWILAAIGGALGGGLFLWAAPVPCRSTSDAEPECDEWGRGILRACEPNEKHRRRQNELLRDAVTGRRWPDRIWEEPMTRMALAGSVLGVAMFGVALPAYWIAGF